MPTFVAGHNSAFWLDNSAGTLTDLTTYFRSCTGSGFQQAMLDSTATGNSSLASIPGLKQGNQISLQGNWDATAHAHMNACGAAQTASTTWTFRYSPAGTGTGNPYEQIEVYVMSANKGSTVDGMVTLDVTLQATGNLTTGTH